TSFSRDWSSDVCSSDLNERRENADRLLCKLIQQRKMPVLGVGLGMEEMAVCYGGGLYQHLPEDLPRCIPHRDPQGGEHRHIVMRSEERRVGKAGQQRDP